jgi:hypothetical protein
LPLPDQLLTLFRNPCYAGEIHQWGMVMPKRRNGGRDSPGQLLIPWSDPVPKAAPQRPASQEPEGQHAPALVQRLKWDFRKDRRTTCGKGEVLSHADAEMARHWFRTQAAARSG